MSIGNLILSVNSATASYLIRYDSLLQNAKDIITKRDCYFIKNAAEVYYKISQFFLTKSDNFDAKCDSYHKFRRFYCKMRHLLQNAAFITNCDSTYDILNRSFSWRYIIHNFKIIQ